MISDFIDENDFRNALTIANRKHDIVAIRIRPPHGRVT